MDLLKVDSVSKYFHDTNTTALDMVSMEVKAGEVHALVGENGAGKSTLAKILCGFIKPDAGRLFVKGKERLFSSHKVAERAGIALVPQYSMLAPMLNGRDNIALGHEPKKFGLFYNRQRAEYDFLLLAERFGFTVDPLKPVALLTMSERRELEIMRALARAGDVLVLDEPTSILGEKESASLFSLIRRLKGYGLGIVYISHRSSEILAIADRITVLRDGRLLNTVAAKNLDERSLAELILPGNKIFKNRKKAKITDKKAVLELESISVKSRIVGLSLSVCAGEIVGIIALDGNGLEELEAIISGQKKPDKGQVSFKVSFQDSFMGEKTNTNDFHKKRSFMAYIPTNREDAALCMKASVAMNVLSLKLHSFSFMEYAMAMAPLAEAEAMLSPIGIKAWKNRGIDTLSGGNRQRVVAARELDGHKALVIAANPAQGLDSAAKSLIFNKLLDMREKGSAILLLSSDPDDIAIADRTYTLYRGKLAELSSGASALATGLTGAEQ